MYDHLNETANKHINSRKFMVIQEIKNAGLEPIIEKVKDNLSDTEAALLEEQLIKKYGRAGYDIGGILTNICLDNSPPSFAGKTHSEESRQKMSEATKGQLCSPETRQKMSKNTKDRIKRGEFGRTGPHTESTKKRISKSKTGTKQSAESSEKKSKALKGKPWSEAKRKSYEALKGSEKEKATLEKKSKALKGKPWSEARRLAYEMKKKQ